MCKYVVRQVLFLFHTFSGGEEVVQVEISLPLHKRCSVNCYLQFMFTTCSSHIETINLKDDFLAESHMNPIKHFF